MIPKMWILCMMFMSTIMATWENEQTQTDAAKTGKSLIKNQNDEARKTEETDAKETILVPNIIQVYLQK